MYRNSDTLSGGASLFVSASNKSQYSNFLLSPNSKLWISAVSHPQDIREEEICQLRENYHSPEELGQWTNLRLLNHREKRGDGR